MGIEPTFKAWEALVLPLNYTREFIQPSSMNPCNQSSALSPAHFLSVPFCLRIGAYAPHHYSRYSM